MRKNIMREEMKKKSRFGETLKALRYRTNLTQTELAARIKVCPAQISIWEKGKTEPGAYAVMVLAETFGISSEQILGYKPLTKEDEFRLFSQWA